jgi:hypothetical protein
LDWLGDWHSLKYAFANDRGVRQMDIAERREDPWVITDKEVSGQETHIEAYV